MCLYTTSKKVQVAKKDMVCYKVMAEYSGDNGWWISPYQGMAYKEGYTYELGEQLQLMDVSETLKELRYPYKVEEGFHSFTNSTDALSFRNALEARFSRLSVRQYTYVIVKCIIPKESAYVEGSYFDWGNNFSSFCSEKIVCEGKIKSGY